MIFYAHFLLFRVAGASPSCHQRQDATWWGHWSITETNKHARSYSLKPRNNLTCTCLDCWRKPNSSWDSGQKASCWEATADIKNLPLTRHQWSESDKRGEVSSQRDASAWCLFVPITHSLASRQKAANAILRWNFPLNTRYETLRWSGFQSVCDYSNKRAAAGCH